MVAGAGNSGQPTPSFTELSRAAVAESRHPCRGVLPGDAAAFEPPLLLVNNPCPLLLLLTPIKAHQFTELETWCSDPFSLLCALSRVSRHACCISLGKVRHTKFVARAGTQQKQRLSGARTTYGYQILQMKLRSLRMEHPQRKFQRSHLFRYNVF